MCLIPFSLKVNTQPKRHHRTEFVAAAAAAIGIIVGIYVKYGRNGTSGQDSGETLYGKIEAIAGQSDARIGFAAVFHDGSMMVYSNAEAGKDSTAAGTGMPAGAYPMLSVMKFHQALAVCGWLKERGIPLTEKDTCGT